MWPAQPLLSAASSLIPVAFLALCATEFPSGSELPVSEKYQQSAIHSVLLLVVISLPHGLTAYAYFP